MLFDYPVQYGFLIRLNIHEEDMFAVIYHPFKIAKVSVRHLDAKEAAFPDAEAK
ncbi:hypothetical protein D9M71_173860 [compost metagenome]